MSHGPSLDPRYCICGDTMTHGMAEPTVSPIRSEAWQAAGPPAPPGAFDRGMEGSELAAGKWTPAQQAAVSKAIWQVAADLYEFTADNIWEILGPDFPVTKGLAGRLNAARHAGLIEPTGQVVMSQRDGAHGHSQRLAVWRAIR